MKLRCIGVLSKTLIVALLIVVSSNVNAGVKCSGFVRVLAIGPKSGILQVDSGFGVHYLCKVHDVMNGVHPEICKTWFTMFMTAKIANKKIAQYYDDGSICSAEYLGNWAIPKVFPYFVNMEN